MMADTGSRGAALARVVALGLLLPMVSGCVGSSPDADSDRDGLTDAFEAAERGVAINGILGIVIHKVTSDPFDADTDGDGLDDFYEAQAGTDPSLMDSDEDGLSDKDEVHLCTESNAATHFDSDRPLPDGLPDGEELTGWKIVVRGVAKQVTSDPCDPDLDDDAVSDLDEKRRGTDPNSRDTDSDKAVDSADVDPTWDLGVAFTLRIARVENSSVQIDSPVRVEVRSDEGAKVDNMSLKDAPGLAYSGVVDAGDAGLPGGLAPRSLFIFVIDSAGRVLNISSGADPRVFQFTFDLTTGKAKWASGESTTGTGFTSGTEARIDFILKTARS
ncbi:MAG: hypothetical protein HY556_09225 [Euryarchaeota archaeon]|nr:hypothetical protein [Euryarchaeota archaeon]